MPCHFPLKGWRAKRVNPSGKRSLVFNPKDGFRDLEVTVPCGQCVDCRLEYSRQWAIRCVHEAELHEANSFVTLTFNDDYLPKDGSLDHSIFQAFLKRLRRRLEYHHGVEVRFYMCGEYGAKLGRPHYHALLFGWDFPDRFHWVTRHGFPLYRSPLLEECWPFGFSTVGELNFLSAAYVARYVLKKVTGEAARDHYQWFDPFTGEIFFLKPEYTRMSLKPGIGADWWALNGEAVKARDSVIIRGREMRPPRFYDRMFQHEDSELFEAVRKNRVRAARRRVRSMCDVPHERAAAKARLVAERLPRVLD